MTKKILAIVLAVLLLGAALAACGGGSTTPSNTPSNNTPSNTPSNNTPSNNTPSNNTPSNTSSEPEYTIKYACINGQGSIQDTEFDTPFKEYLEKASNGRLGVEIYYSGALSGQGTTFESIINGTTDAGYDAPEQYSGYFPYILLYVHPGWYYGTPDDAYNTLLEYADQYKDPFMEDNFKVVAWEISPGIGVLNNIELKETPQWQGFSVRAQAAQVDWLAKMGANGVSMSIADVYESFRLNVIDGCITGIIAFKTFSFPEVCNYFTWLPMINGATCYVFSKPLYDSFDPELQAALDDSFAYAQANLAMADINAQAQASKDYAAEVNPNFKYVDLTEETIATMVKNAEPEKQALVESMNAQGLDGTGAYEWLLAHSK